MSVRAYNPEDNSPVLLSDEEAADAITSGRYVLANDQAVPVRAPNGTIERYRAGDPGLRDLLSQQGYALDFVNGNQQRYNELYQQRTSQVLREDFGGAIGEAVAGAAMGYANYFSQGLADVSEQQSEDERLASVQSNTPNQGKLEYYLNNGLDYDDALIYATDSYRRPTLRDATSANTPLASAAGSVYGGLAGAVALAPLAAAAEPVVAARAAATLARAGVGTAASTLGGQVAAGAIVGATEAAATRAATNIGEGIIRERLPEFNGEELLILGGIGAVVGGGMNLAVDGTRFLRSRAAGGQASLVAPVVSNRDAIQRLTDDVTSSLDPQSVTPMQNAIVQMNQTLGQVDPALNASFFNSEKIRRANITDEAHNQAATDITDMIGDIQTLNNITEVGVATQSRQDLANSVQQFVDSADNATVLNASRGVIDYVDTLDESFQLNGRNIIQGRDSPIVNSFNSFMRRVRDATSDVRSTVRRADEIEQALESAARPAREAQMAVYRQQAREALEKTKVELFNATGVTDDDFAEYVATLPANVRRTISDSSGYLRDMEEAVYSRELRNNFIPGSAAPLLEEAAALPQRLADSYKALPDVLVNIQTNLANLSRSVKSSAEQDLAQVADAALSSFDNFLTRPEIFGTGAAAAFRDTPAIRTMQSNRNQLLKLFGRDGITELDRVGRDFDPSKLVSLSMRASDADTIAGRKVIADYLRASQRVADIEAALGNTAPLERIDDVARRLSGTSEELVAGESPFFGVGRAKADFKQLQLQGNQGGTLRGVAPSIVMGMFGAGIVSGSAALPAAALVTMLAMRPDKRVAASYALRNLRSAYDGTKAKLIAAVGARMSMPTATLGVSKQVARRVITATPQLFEGEDRDEAFNNLVAVVNEAAGSPDYMANAAESFGVNPTSRNGSEAITNMVVAMEYLRQQMPESLFDPLNPNPPAQRVSGMVKFNILRTVETIMDPHSVYEDFANGVVSATKVQALRAVYPQTAEEMNARVLAEYSDRVSAGMRMPYATRMQVSMLLGTPIEQALRQPNLARLQSVYAQTPAQAQAQGMSRTPTRAVTSLVTSTSTEGASLQDLQ
jgi:molecular chaperone GrpE (heat shock protein)